MSAKIIPFPSRPVMADYRSQNVNIQHGDLEAMAGLSTWFAEPHEIK